MLAGGFNTEVYAAVASSLLNTPIDLFHNGGLLIYSFTSFESKNSFVFYTWPYRGQKELLSNI